MALTFDEISARYNEGGDLRSISVVYVHSQEFESFAKGFQERYFPSNPHILDPYIRRGGIPILSGAIFMKRNDHVPPGEVWVIRKWEGESIDI